MQLNVISGSAYETQKVAEKIGRKLKGGEVIELVSDLGGGKTTFVSGLAIGIKSKDKVSSPTFTISKVYKGDKLTIYHFDFYRLDEPGVIEFELDDILNEADAVVVIEWPALLENKLPKERLSIKFNQTVDINKRSLVFNYPDTLSYLIPENVNTIN